MSKLSKIYNGAMEHNIKPWIDKYTQFGFEILQYHQYNLTLRILKISNLYHNSYKYQLITLRDMQELATTKGNNNINMNGNLHWWLKF